MASAGWHHFDGAQSVQHVLSFGAFVVTNFSSLGPGDNEVKMIPRTEDRGIRTLEELSKLSSEVVKRCCCKAGGCASVSRLEGISQLKSLLKFVEQRVHFWFETSTRGTLPQGQQLTLEMPLDWIPA